MNVPMSATRSAINRLRKSGARKARHGLAVGLFGDVIRTQPIALMGKTRAAGKRLAHSG
jgi:hypothetical protein